MLQILMIIGWVLAIVCMLYLAKELVMDRLRARSERRRERLIENRRRLMQRAGQAVPPAPRAATADRQQNQKLFGWLALILWQGYWLIEIADQFKKSDHPLQLPYFFLFVVMVVIPYAIYRFARRRNRHPRML